MTKHIWCDVCESSKGPLYKIIGDDRQKRYICKNCLITLRMMKADEKIARDAERARDGEYK